MASDTATAPPVRPTEVPAAPALATQPLLGSADVDRLARLTHALLEEVADLSVRLERVEARLDGREPPADLQAIQARVAALVGRVTG